MKRYLYRTVCAAAVLYACASGLPARAQDIDLSFDTFHDQLASYGDWVYSDRWGEAWIPNDVPDDFQPYGTKGYWVDTNDYGWTWASDYDWGDIPFHYGRWVNDPDDGWLWLPGYVWSPAWVVWRSNDHVIGWMPMPPDRQFLNGTVEIGAAGFSFAANFNSPRGFYGYSQWYGPSYGDDRFAANWVFIDTAHFADRDFHNYEQPRASYTTIINTTTNVTNYTVVNNIVVNKSVDVAAVERASGHPIKPVAAATALHKAQFITHVDQGRQAQTAMRTVTPHGTGTAGSAPPPSQKIVQSLSAKVPQRSGHAPMHVYSRETVAAVAKAPPANGLRPNPPAKPTTTTAGAPATAMRPEAPHPGPNTQPSAAAETHPGAPARPAPALAPSRETESAPARAAQSEQRRTPPAEPNHETAPAERQPAKPEAAKPALSAERPNPTPERASPPAAQKAPPPKEEPKKQEPKKEEPKKPEPRTDSPPA